MIEVKFGTNPVSPGQVLSHASGWLGLAKGDFKNHLVPLIWHDVLRAIDAIDVQTITPIEEKLLGELREFLGLYGYKLFMGFDFSSLMAARSLHEEHNFLLETCHLLVV